MRLFVALVLPVVSSFLGAQALADEVGRSEYLAACAGCHGRSAEGNGAMSQNLNINAPNLTNLALRNGGAFPFERTLRLIDGRDEVRLHGSPMPIWGDRFFAIASESEDARDAEIETRGRLLSLVYYLESVQKK